MNKIKVLYVKPRETAKIIEIDNTLKNLQELVGGNIELVYPYDNKIVFIVNEEGRLLNLQPNRIIKGQLIVGNFIIAGIKDDDFTSLSDDQLSEFKKFLGMKSYI